jgi:FtsH-binding integral membrane protein
MIAAMAADQEQGDYSSSQPVDDDLVPQGSLGAALDPRRRIYRDPFNELVVFVVSATGAAVIAPVILLIVKAFSSELDLIPFTLICVGIELFLIFGLARPAMKPQERVGWALLWGFAAAVLGMAFWSLVYTQL